MTDRVKGCWVAFEKPIREDDAEAMVNAIKMVKGVAGVTTSVCDGNDYMTQQTIRFELQGKLFKFLDDLFREKTK